MTPLPPANKHVPFPQPAQRLFSTWPNRSQESQNMLLQKTQAEQQATLLWSKRQSNQRIALQYRIHSWQGSKCWGLVWRRQMLFFPPLQAYSREFPITNQTLFSLCGPHLWSRTAVLVEKHFSKRSQKRQQTKKPCLILFQRWHWLRLSSDVKAVTVNKGLVGMPNCVISMLFSLPLLTLSNRRWIQNRMVSGLTANQQSDGREMTQRTDEEKATSSKALWQLQQRCLGEHSATVLGGFPHNMHICTATVPVLGKAAPIS